MGRTLDSLFTYSFILHSTGIILGIGLIGKQQRKSACFPFSQRAWYSVLWQTFAQELYEHEDESHPKQEAKSGKTKFLTSVKLSSFSTKHSQLLTAQIILNSHLGTLPLPPYGPQMTPPHVSHPCLDAPQFLHPSSSPGHGTSLFQVLQCPPLWLNSNLWHPSCWLGPINFNKSSHCTP